MIYLGLKLEDNAPLMIDYFKGREGNMGSKVIFPF
jgi:hypothetical protein